MYLWMVQRRSSVQLIQKCFCQNNSNYSQHRVLLSVNAHISFSNRSFMNILNSTNTNLITPNTFLSKNNSIELTAVSEKNFSSSNENQPPSTTKPPELSNKDKLKRAIKDYGATVIVFHVTISLMSLGISYLVISSGVDVASLLGKIGLDSKSDFTAGASTFVVAYAVHKVFAPVRISITLGATPFIVRYFRRIGVLKPPKNTTP